MDNLFVNCNNCGSSLQIDEEVMFTTCRNCKSSLEIVRTLNAVFTKVINQQEVSKIEFIDRLDTPNLDLDFNPVNNQLIELEEQWQNNLAQYEYKGLIPNLNKVNGFVLLFLMLLFLGLTVLMFLFNIYIGLILIFVFLFIIVLIINEINRSMTYIKAKKEYEAKRTKFLEKLNHD